MNIALITGASGEIGFEFAKKIDMFNLDEIWLICGKRDISVEISNFKSKAKVIHLDLADENSFSVISSMLSDANATVKYLVNSAGIGFNGKFENLSLNEISKTVTINCSSLALTVKAVLPFMKNGSEIINIASGAGFLPQPYFSVYSASKSFVISFSRSLRQELKKQKISVCAVCPGPVNTEFFRSLNPSEYKKKFAISPEKVARKGIKASKRHKPICSPSFSMKFVRLISKIIPTSIIMNFYK